MQTVERGGAVLAALLFCSLSLSACENPDARCSSYIRRGERYLAAGNLDKAQVEFRNAMQIDPRRADARVMSARVEERRGNIRDALGLYQSAVDIDPSYLPARAKLARLYVLAGKPDRALDIVRPGLQQRPDDPELLAARAAARAVSGEREGALADAERAVKLAPDSEDAVGLLAALDRQAGKTQQAIDLVRAAIGKNPASTDLRRILADLYLKSGREDLAEAELSKLIALEPRELDLRYRLVSLYVRSKRLADAERVLQGAIAARPDDDAPKLAYVSLLATQRSPGEGERALEGFIARSPADFDMQLAAPGLLLQEGRIDAAIAAYRTVIARAGDRPQGLTARDRLAALLVADRSFDEASTLVRQVLEKNDHVMDALATRAEIAQARGEPMEAVTDLRAVARDRPRSEAVLRALARAYLTEGKTELAEASLRSAIEATPQESAARVELARLLAQTNRVDEATALLEDRLRLVPADLLAGEALVRLSIAKQDFKAAGETAQQLEQRLPREWRGPYLEGLVAEAQKQLGAAEADFGRALAVQPDAMQALRAISGLELSSGHADRAIARAQSLAANEPANAEVCDLLGELRLATKDSAGAIRELTRCTQVAPAIWLAYHDLGAAEIAAGDSAGAMRTYERGVAATHMEPPLVVELAALYEQQGRSGDAIKTYEALHREFPGLAVATNNLAMLIVTHEKDRVSLERARDLTSGFLDSQDPRLLDTAGWVLLKCGDSTQALPVLERAAHRDSGSRVIRYHLGMAQLETGQRDRARASLETSLAGSARFEGSDDARAALVRLGS